MTGCPPEEALVALAERRLSGDEAERIRDHIEDCERCSQLFDALAPEEEEAPPLPSLTPEAKPGEQKGWTPPTLFDDFDLLGQLGRGGMGEVYLARERALDRIVALKFIRAGNSDLRAFERFMVEARAIARLQHPNVVSIFRVGEVLGQPYIVYEFVSGHTLDKLSKPVPWPSVLDIGLGIARGLAAAHQRGVLHRDIKPGNVILGAAGEVKLLDFGLAKLVDQRRSPDDVRDKGEPRALDLPPAPADPNETVPTPNSPGRPQPGQESSHLTGDHMLLGTPLYLAPELWDGGMANARSDVYAFGLVLYELCAGRLPHAGLDLATLARVMPTLDLPPVVTRAADVPRSLAEIVDRCVRRVPGDRFQSAEEVRAALEEVHTFSRAFGIQAQPTGAPASSAAALVSHSFARLGPRVEALVVRFYDRLLDDVPRLRKLFPDDLRAQRVKLATALRVIVDNLHTPDRLDPMLETLGRSHAAYGMGPEHVTVVREALLAALAETEGEHWNLQLRQAWIDIYEQVASAMGRGMAQASLRDRGSARQLESLPPPSTGNIAEIVYASSGDTALAYQVLGRGPLDLVLVQGWVTHLENIWEHPAPARFLEKLASMARLILFDQRGTGLSERDGAGASPDQRMEDLRAVLDAAGSRRAVLLGEGAGLAPCVSFARAHPDRTLGLIAYGSTARISAGPGSPHGQTPADLEHLEREIRTGWGRPIFIEQEAPSLAHEPSFRRWWASYLRLGATPGGAIRMLKTSARVDLRTALTRVRTPSLVLHRTGDQIFPAAAGRDLAARIPGAHYMELPGADHLPYAGDTESVLEQLQRFLAQPALLRDDA